MGQRFILHRWEHSTKHRYYIAYLAHDLLGWCLTSAWGGIDKATGRLVNHPCHSFDDGLQQFQRISQRRKQRGYQLVHQASNPEASVESAPGYHENNVK